MSAYKDKPVPPAKLKDFPGLSKVDLQTVDRLFTPYLFFENEKGGRRVWTSCCHKDKFIEERGRTQKPADRLILSARHNEYVTCPYCGRVVYAKNRKMIRRGVKLQEYHAVVFLHVSKDGDTVWAQGYWATKDFVWNAAGPVLYKATRVYRFQPGKATQWDIGYYGDIWEKKHPKMNEPCMDNGTEPYTPVGLERLEHSFLKYTGYAEPMPQDHRQRRLWDERGVRDDLIRYLAAAARYPRQVELARKAGLNELLGDLVWAWKKNADVFKWKETDPYKAFGLSKSELKEFMDGEKRMDVLRVLKKVRKLGGKMTIPEAQALKNRMGIHEFEMVTKRAEQYSVPVARLLKYLDGFTGQRCYGGMVTMNAMARTWADYIDMAAKLGYDLSNPIWQMPKDLDAKHDQLAEAVNALKVELRREAATARRREVDKKYGFAMDGYIIRAPLDGEEITAEGRALKHCVGGYADRHMNGTTTILFLRRADDPDTPYVTIEMHGNRMRQIHGYKNEGEACPANPDKRPIKELHKELIDTWLDWVRKGSRRNKMGEPSLPKKKVVSVA